jgi:hypothetical protein
MHTAIQELVPLVLQSSVTVIILEDLCYCLILILVTTTKFKSEAF